MTMVRAARPDLTAFDRATRLAFPKVVAELSRVLGAKMVAYLAGVRETRVVRSWSDGSRASRLDADGQQRLRTALHVALMLEEHDDAEVTQAWFQGLNPQLDDQSPLRLLREGDSRQAGPEVLAAARAFVAGG